MAAALASNAQPSPSLSDTYAQCIQFFDILVQAIREPDCLISCRGFVHATEIIDEYGRAKIWGDQTKASLPAKARGSLDDTLRHDPDLKLQVQEILLRLKEILKQTIPIANRKFNPALGFDQGSISSVSADSDDGTDEDSDADWGFSTSPRTEPDRLLADTTDISMEEMEEHPRETGEKPSRIARICVLVQQVQSQIRSLFDVSSLLRRPGVTEKDLQDNLMLGVTMKTLDERQVEEKVLQWRRLKKSGSGSSHISQLWATETTSENDLGSALIQAKTWLYQRLGQGNTRRREQLEYWKSHPYGASPEAKRRVRYRSQASTIYPRMHQVTSQRATIDELYFSEAAYPGVHNTADRAWTMYAPSASSQDCENDIPNPPKTDDGVAMFPCPCCGTALDVEEMQNRQAWRQVSPLSRSRADRKCWLSRLAASHSHIQLTQRKRRHVFHDLQPYMCTFEHCSSGSKLYSSRSDWIHHELQVHRRRFICSQPGCANVFESRTQIEAHLQNDHFTNKSWISTDELALIVDLCDRPVDLWEPIPGQECILCQEPTVFVGLLQEHLAVHMEDIAFLVLPDVAGGDDLQGAFGPSLQFAPTAKAKGRRNDFLSDYSSLEFQFGYAQDSTAQAVETIQTNIAADDPGTLFFETDFYETYLMLKSHDEGRDEGFDEAEILGTQAMEARNTKIKGQTKWKEEAYGVWVCNVHILSVQIVKCIDEISTIFTRLCDSMC